jgi:hypothetical protein
VSQDTNDEKDDDVCRLVRTGFLEGMAAKGLTDFAYFKYLHLVPTLAEDGAFPLPTSTKASLPVPPLFLLFVWTEQWHISSNSSGSNLCCVVT